MAVRFPNSESGESAAIASTAATANSGHSKNFIVQIVPRQFHAQKSMKKARGRKRIRRRACRDTLAGGSSENLT